MVECLLEYIRPTALATSAAVEITFSPVDAEKSDDQAAMSVLYGSSSAHIGGGIRQKDDAVADTMLLAPNALGGHLSHRWVGVWRLPTSASKEPVGGGCRWSSPPTGRGTSVMVSSSYFTSSYFFSLRTNKMTPENTLGICPVS